MTEEKHPTTSQPEKRTMYCEKLTKNIKHVVTKDIATVLTLFGPSLMIRSPSSPVLWHSSFRQ
jgi:hypothetical protein